MPLKQTLKLRCPICKKAVKSGNADFPFCSDRCRSIDLGKWASGAYLIPSPVTDYDEQLQDRALENRDEDRKENQDANQDTDQDADQDANRDKDL